MPAVTASLTGAMLLAFLAVSRAAQCVLTRLQSTLAVAGCHHAIEVVPRKRINSISYALHTGGILHPVVLFVEVGLCLLDQVAPSWQVPWFASTRYRRPAAAESRLS